MEYITPSAIALSGSPRSGVINESGITNGYACTLISYDADVHQVTVVYSNGMARTLDASHLGDTLLMWAALPLRRGVRKPLDPVAAHLLGPV